MHSLSQAIRREETAVNKARGRLAFAHRKFGAELRARRERRAKSLRQVARTVGVSAAYLSDIELGRRHAPAVTRERIMRVLGELR